MVGYKRQARLAHMDECAGHLTSTFLKDYSHALAPQGPVPLKLQLTLNGLEMAKIACHFCSHMHFSAVSEQSLCKIK